MRGFFFTGVLTCWWPVMQSRTLAVEFVVMSTPLISRGPRRSRARLADSTANTGVGPRSFWRAG